MKAESGALSTLSDMVSFYASQLARLAKDRTEHYGRSETNLDDFAQALHQVGARDTDELRMQLLSSKVYRPTTDTAATTARHFLQAVEGRGGGDGGGGGGGGGGGVGGGE